MKQHVFYCTEESLSKVTMVHDRFGVVFRGFHRPVTIGEIIVPANLLSRKRGGKPLMDRPLHCKILRPATHEEVEALLKKANPRKRLSQWSRGMSWYEIHAD